MADDHRLDVTVARRVSYTPWWAGLTRRLEKFVAMIPSHRDTRSGRRNATQIRVALLAIGILTVVLWESQWAPLALIACVLALFVPISQSKRRELVASLRSRRTKASRVDRTAGTLSISEKHVTLTVDGERVRRLRRNQMSTEKSPKRLTMNVGQKKANTLSIFAGEGNPDLDVWAERADLDAITEICNA